MVRIRNTVHYLLLRTQFSSIKSNKCSTPLNISTDLHIKCVRYTVCVYTMNSLFSCSRHLPLYSEFVFLSMIICCLICVRYAHFFCLIRTLLDMNFDIIVGIIIIFVFDTLFDACIFILNSNIRCHSLNGQLYQTAHMSCMHETSPSWLHSMLAPIEYGKWWLSVIPA